MQYETYDLTSEFVHAFEGDSEPISWLKTDMVRVTLNNATYSIQNIVYRVQNTKSQLKIQSNKPNNRLESGISNANTAYKQDIL